MKHELRWLIQRFGIEGGRGAAKYADECTTRLQTRITELESQISGLMHTYCECGDEFTNTSESHYMIIEDGKCVNCRCADAAPLEIRDSFLDGLYEGRKLTAKEQ